MTIHANDSGSPYGAEIVRGERWFCNHHVSGGNTVKIERPTFEHSLATYLTRNGRCGDTAKVQREIEQFMYDRKPR